MIWIAIYWLLMFCIMLYKNPKPDHWTVWMMVFFFSFFFPIMFIYFLVKEFIARVSEK